MDHRLLGQVFIIQGWKVCAGMFIQLSTTVLIKIFIELEEREALDPSSDADLFCLHYVSPPQINSCLKAFSTAWNNNELSTAEGAPLQLFTARLLTTEDKTVLEDIKVYGVDTDESITVTG